MDFHKDILKIDSKVESERVSSLIEKQVAEMKLDGVVVGISGGIDSALSAALSVRALGKEKVFGLILPEKESSPCSARYAEKFAQELGIGYETVDITQALESLGAYQKRDDTIRSIFPEYNSGYRSKITLPPDLIQKDAYNIFTLTIESEEGIKKTARLNKTALNNIVASTNIKQRTRMVQLYYHAEKMNYLVCGTTNRTETVLGFFVKYGDGGVDIEPLAHLYKTQIYQLAEYLGVTKEIIERDPSPDTYTADVNDQDFYFRVPLDKLDLLLYSWENRVDMDEVCRIMELSQEQVKRVYRDFLSKSSKTESMRSMPPVVE
ncbi:NAD(+) synthase [Elusimicrobiota bacterium]